MAIFSKNKKNKKDGSRNSVVPKTLESVKDAIVGDDNASQRQVSGTSTINSTNSVISNQSITGAPSHMNIYPGSNQPGPYPGRQSGGISPQTSTGNNNNNGGSNSRSNSAMSGHGINGANGNGVRSPLGLRSATSPVGGQQYPGGNQWGSQGGHPQQQPRAPQLHHQQSMPGGLRSSPQQPQAQSQSPHPSTQPQYPWSRHHISNATPFPRHGHAANAVAARDGEVFVMGGLKGSSVFGDLWVIETGKHHHPGVPPAAGLCPDP